MSNTNIKAENLTEAEHQWIAQQRNTCLQLVSLYLNQPLFEAPSIAELHQAFDNWLELFIRSTSKRRLFSKKITVADPNDIALSFGVAFGDHIQATTTLEWKIVTDDYGTDMMLFAAGVKGEYTDIINAPISMISKRIEHREHGWLRPTFEQLIEQLNEMSGKK